MGKGKKKQKQDSDEEVDDVMAWGKSKQNYYREEQDQYSEASQQQDEAKQIYENQYQALNKQDFYQLPEQDEQNYEQAEEQEDPSGINEEYINKEILWATQLAKMFEGVKDSKSEFRKKVYDSYLLILMCLKSFKIQYVDQHPFVQNLPMLKKALKHFQQQLPALYEHMMGDQKANNTQQGLDDNSEQQYEEDMENQQDIQDNQESFNEDEGDSIEEPVKNKSRNKNNLEGLEIYQKIKQQKQQERKIKKAENKQRRQETRPKAAFKLVSQNQGRLANEKMLKNKGLLKKRGRDAGNSRTKLRHKYQKALVKRSAQGKIGVKQNPGRYYEGEDKVLYGKIASTKLK